MTYSKEFINSFALLSKKLDDIDIARYLKITKSQVVAIRKQIEEESKGGK